MSLSERVAAEIRAEMGRQRRTGHSLAAQLGWSDMYLSRRLSGRGPLNLDDVEAIATALEVPVTAFFDFPVRAGAWGQLRNNLPGGAGVRSSSALTLAAAA